MGRGRWLSVVIGLSLVSVVVGCTTITEELPTRPTPQVVTAPIPVVVVVPAPLPAPANPAPAPAPAPTAKPGPTPAPNPAPTPKPAPNPEPAPSGDAIVRIGLKVYFVECGGQEVPGSEGASEAQVGCRVHMDATPKDANNKPTVPKGTPSWYYSEPSLINASGKNPFGPVLMVKGRGTLSISVTCDRVESNTVTIRLY